MTTGAENDLEHATALARQMVGLYGMSESIGLVHVGQKQNPLLPALQDGPIQRDCSEQTAREIDEEVKRLLSEAYDSARGILSSHRDQLDSVARGAPEARDPRRGGLQGAPGESGTGPRAIDASRGCSGPRQRSACSDKPAERQKQS